MALDYLWPNLDQRPAIQILAEAWDKDVIQTQLALNDKYGTAGFYEIRQELEQMGYGFVEQGSGYGATKTRGFVKTIGETGTFATNPVEVGINSNATKTVHGSSTVAYDMAKDATTGKVSFTGLAKNGFKMFASAGATALNTIGCVSTGCFLGKAIDGALYRAFPDFWDSIGLSTWNPETWDSIVAGDDSFGAGLISFLLGLNPDTGEAIGYLDERALAYIAMVLKQNGFFASGRQSITPPISELQYYDSELSILYLSSYSLTSSLTIIRPDDSTPIINTSSGYVINTHFRENNKDYDWVFIVSEEPFTVTGSNVSAFHTPTAVTYHDITYYVSNLVSYGTYANKYSYPSNLVYDGVPSAYFVNNYSKWLVAYYIYSGHIASALPGVSDQPNATQPDTSDWDTPEDTLASLQRQYPDSFSDPLIQHSYNPDGSENTTRYVPVPLPTAKSLTDTQPVTGTATQTQPQQNPAREISSMPQELLDWVTRYTVPTTTPNPQDTGSGTTPTPTAPVGNASALWSVYHPTQAQVNAFGGWLWGSPFLTNIGKLFENPIDGVISLHKIYATPVDAGSGTIVVGTLDSQVPSATINQQYVTVDCGSVDCHEDFGTVFDYPPFTKVYLYLPFVGIVPLDTNDVMRSTLHVVYGVDVFTGACIAMVEVTRDGNTINMYQYTGNCAVHYPLSNMQQSQLLSGLISVAAGVGSIVATGGASVPAVAGILHGAATAANTSIGRSGGFSANAGAMGIKKPYIIIQRPQTKVAEQFTTLAGYPTNISGKLSDFSGQVNVTYVHVSGIPATREELELIKSLLKEGVEI